MKKPTLQNVLAKKLKPAPETAPPPQVARPKADDGKITTSLRIEPDLLVELKSLAVHERRRVNDMILEAIRNYLAMRGRHAA